MHPSARTYTTLVFTLGVLCTIGAVPILWSAMRALAVRDYVGGGLLVFGAAAAGNLGLELDIPAGFFV